jgi:hypothetical protein
MKNELIEIRNGILSALEQNDGILSKMYVNELDTLIHELSNQQETLEEIRKYAELSYYNGDEVNAFIDGVKYKSKRMYSEEDMINFHKWAYQKNRIEECDKTTKGLLKEWFEQFKKTKL